MHYITEYLLNPEIIPNYEARNLLLHLWIEGLQYFVSYFLKVSVSSDNQQKLFGILYIFVQLFS